MASLHILKSTLSPLSISPSKNLLGKSNSRKTIFKLTTLCGSSRRFFERPQKFKVLCSVQEEDNSQRNGEEPPESLFMKELKRRGMAPTSLLEETNRGNYGVEDEMKIGEKDRGFSKRNSVSTELNESLSNQREKSMALNSEGLEGLIPRAKLLLTIGGTFFLGFWPLILITVTFFSGLYFYFGPSFVHDGRDAPVSPPPYIDPYEMLEDERISQIAPNTSLGYRKADMVTGPVNEQSFALHIVKTDDDGRLKRTGSLMAASAHIITAVIGSGVLSLAWATAQLGWIAGPIALLIFSVVTWFTSCLLADCYRFPGPHEGTRTYTYMGAVKAHLGGIKYILCGISQYTNLVGTSIGYTITASISMAAIKRSNCFHKEGHKAECHASTNMFMIIFGIVQIIMSQLPNFHKLAGLSTLAAIMSFAYALIGIGLSIAEIAGGNRVKTSLTGTVVGVDVTSTEKAWNCFQAIGNIAFAYTYTSILVEIQDTLKSSPPENREMKKASLVGVATTTLFYMLCGTLGYAAFGNKAPGNFLTGFGFYEPYWLIDFANMCIVIHLIGAYQVFCQPTFKLVEDWCSKKWPASGFVTNEHPVRIPFCGVFPVNSFRLLWRTAYVIASSVLAMTFPFFNSVLGLIGAISFWPLTLYFPVQMYISQAKIGPFTFTWTWLMILTVSCLIVSLVAAAACVQGLVTELHAYKPFKSVS
ncbi:unnamed protein product [Dovyalis caffra]|uniref:Amino acid transporter transmembrane domain-containing protein n=1 Tax=Dovyalis caffra TaxID=77055 RepID=A0AAV1R8F7_9ROSI|nr:unnamed protein product [Dovyalis caffra]